ncbi:MAG: zinc ABC transporter substrate-binding protein [Rhodobacteraceae bacterium]|jgi:manganese/zinc/iron transport system substrate-binding protein|nr:zinc ABC transporter substrate-binding protein [Paracoccaceae bacterium]
MLDRRALIAMILTSPVMPMAARASTPAIVATTGMIADLARRITGAEVQAIFGPGVDPHGHRPTRTDILALSRGDLILHNGLNLEAQLTDLLTDMATQTRVLAVAESIDPGLLLNDPAYAGFPDPHVWMDPTLWSTAAQAIAAALSDMGYPGDLAANTQALLDDLAALDNYARTAIASIPEPARVLITAHDAFNYLGRAYGLEVQGIQGISTESEAGVARMQELVTLIRDRQVPAVFVESSVTDRSVRALIEGAAGAGMIVATGGELFSDAMGPEGSYEGTYLGMMDHNITTIAAALGGDVPGRGMSGKLAM